MSVSPLDNNGMSLGSLKNHGEEGEMKGTSNDISFQKTFAPMTGFRSHQPSDMKSRDEYVYEMLPEKTPFQGEDFPNLMMIVHILEEELTDMKKALQQINEHNEKLQRENEALKNQLINNNQKPKVEPEPEDKDKKQTENTQKTENGKSNRNKTGNNVSNQKNQTNGGNNKNNSGVQNKTKPQKKEGGSGTPIPTRKSLNPNGNTPKKKRNKKYSKKA